MEQSARSIEKHAGLGGTRIVEAGALAGLLGGTLMGLWGMVSCAAHGQGPFTQFKLMGATFFGIEALLGGAKFVAWGMLLHVLVSVGWGVLFALAIGPDSARGIALFAGPVCGLAVLVTMTFVFLPALDPVLRQRVPMMRSTWVLQHFLYGVGLAFVPLLRRRLTRRADLERVRAFDRQHERSGLPPALPPL